jgi:transcriptional repressor NrdR
MVCAYCKGKTKVINSRSSSKKHSTWRRRCCTECGAVFTTREIIDLESTLRVINKGGDLSPFLRDKLFASLLLSVSHRKTALTDATALCETVIGRLIASVNHGLIDKASIVDISLEVLKRFDKASATHYHAHHKT